MSHAVRPLRRTWIVLVALGATVLSVPGVNALAQDPQEDETTGAAKLPFQLIEDRPLDPRLPQPEDRYALAGGCYTVQAPDAGYVARTQDGLALTDDADAAEPFHFQPLRLGEYLIATNEGADTTHEGAWWDVRGYLTGDPLPLSVPDVLAAGVSIEDEPSVDAEWTVAATGDEPDARAPQGQAYTLVLAARDQALTVADGALVLTATSDAGAFVFRHVRDDDQSDADPNGAPCADWPEITTNVDGRPAPTGGGAADEVRGFFEAHVHGMAYEFLGGELRCGQPWHPYGVEYALGDCTEDGNHLNGALEVAVAGQDPADPVTTYDPVGWPTFDYWPQHDTLTHEQFYWRWLERAYLGGLRLVTNLLVDNTALCQVYPHKRNSCNEMDGVRLQARRMHELQDYIDAQSGGPGEGWLRIVTTPAQARETINAGRLAVVLGIEVSELFDCREILDEPQCTQEEVDERLQEVFDMGVRQMELINKFDNALAGVTGDGGTTGIVVNSGNRMVTGHWWDMQTCPPIEDHADGHSHDGHQHDKTQINFVDDAPDGGDEDIDVLAGTILSLFAPTKGFVAPAYPAAPHCNTRGLTDLGRHVIEQMIAKGMIFDPDHMSALAQREALDFIEDELIPAEQQAAAAAGRAPIQPAVISSHSWANDVVYQRIYELDGVVAPRTGDAERFADRWVQHRAWAAEHGRDGFDFGMGYGADTNGLGGQPGPRSEPEVPVTYDGGWEAPIGGVTIHQQTSGVRTYDINVDGVAHYGLFADWFHELALAADERYQALGGGEAIIDDMLDGAETYLRIWERAVYGGNDCVVDGSMPQIEDIHAALGGNVEGFLRSIGQPVDRDGSAYVYCAEDDQGLVQVLDVHFNGEGEAEEITPSTSGVTPEATAPGDGHDHVHAVPAAAGGALPATGGGLTTSGLLLLGLVGLGARLLRPRTG